MTEILNEQICGSVKSTTGTIHLICEVRLSRKGVLMAVIGGTIYYLSSNESEQTYIGSFSVSYDDTAQSKRAVAVNLNDTSKFVESTAAITNMISELEEKYA